MRVWGWQSKKRYFSNQWDQYFSILGSIGAAQKQSSVRPHLGWKKKSFYSHFIFTLTQRSWLVKLLPLVEVIATNIYREQYFLMEWVFMCLFIYISFIRSRHQACDITTDIFTSWLHPLSVKTHWCSQVERHATLNFMTDNLCLGVSTSSSDCRMSQPFSSRNGNCLKKRNMEEIGVIEW